METTAVLTKTKWVIDPSHSEIGFKVKHLMITNVKGKFSEFEADIYTTEENFLTAEIDCWMNAASLDTGDDRRDAHLKGADFFDVEHHKQVTFTGNTFEKVKAVHMYELYGDLTMKGITKKIKLDVEFAGIIKDPWGNKKAGFTITGKINRKDWGLNWNTALETGGVMVSDEVQINCDIQLLKKL